MLSKGRKCALNGKLYEKKVSDVISKCFLHSKPFHTHLNVAGCCSEIDVLCNFKGERDIGIEIKKSKAPDWQQCKLAFDKERGKWIPAVKDCNKKDYHYIFEELLENCNLYNGCIPPFMEQSLTHEQWKKIKASTTQWNDFYFDIPNDTIAKMYHSKGCHYIQVGNDYGLYHLGDDICNFNVPAFLVPQQIRIRTKVHTRKNKNGYCSLSVMAACQPKNIKLLPKSPFSLDKRNKLPMNLSFEL